MYILSYDNADGNACTSNPVLNYPVAKRVVDVISVQHLLMARSTYIANEVLRASLAIYHLISNVRSWNNC